METQRREKKKGRGGGGGGGQRWDEEDREWDVGMPPPPHCLRIPPHPALQFPTTRWDSVVCMTDFAFLRRRASFKHP